MNNEKITAWITNLETGESMLLGYCDSIEYTIRSKTENGHYLIRSEKNKDQKEESNES